ncbi:uncharacterized protein LOC135182435 [Pogoniulus pusillus]|uniref:uncharacterized protein LOC135182435 n=1 Tax=Pogoniulus pusillus TaxID=488313 RepID=UPI0030B99916
MGVAGPAAAMGQPVPGAGSVPAGTSTGGKEHFLATTDLLQACQWCPAQTNLVDAPTGVAKVRSGSADSPVSAASSTAQSVPVPLPGKNPTGLPVGQSNSASLPASSTHAPTHGTVVPLQRTSSAPLQPGWHHGDVGKDIRENTDTRWQELFNIKLQIVQYLKAVFVVCVVAATFFLILVLVLCCTAACYCLKKAMGKGSADPGHKLETGSFLSSLKNKRSSPDTAQISAKEQMPEQPLKTAQVEHPPSPLETVAEEQPRRSQEPVPQRRPPSTLETVAEEQPRRSREPVPQRRPSSTLEPPPEEYPRRSWDSVPQRHPPRPQHSMSARSTVGPPSSPSKTFQQPSQQWSHSASSHRTSQHSNRD